MEYKAITKTAVMPTRSHGMGKILIEIIDIHLLTNNILLRDWVLIEDGDGNTIHMEILRDQYIKYYPDTAFSILFSATEIQLNSPEENYLRLKQIANEAIVIMNNVDPPYSLPNNSFEPYSTPTPVVPEPSTEEPPTEEPPVGDEPPTEEPPVGDESPAEEPPVGDEPPIEEEPTP